MARRRFRPSALGADRTFAGLHLRGQYTASGASTQQSRRRKPAVKAAIHHEQFGTASASEPERARPAARTQQSRARQGAGPRAKGDDNRRWAFDRTECGYRKTTAASVAFLLLPISHEDVEFVTALGVVARREHQPFPVGGKLGKGRKASEVGDLLEIVSVHVNQE